DYPAFIAVGHNLTVPGKLKIPYFAVDSSCIVPMGSFSKHEYAAYTIRPKIHKVLSQHLHPLPPLRIKRKFDAVLPAGLHTQVTESNIADLIADCEIDHSIAPSVDIRGGRAAARKRLQHFLRDNLRRYAKYNREPSERATSGLSPYLHFGHISALEVALAAKE